ncbi:TPA: type II secretion system minor pseudopilin GspH [Escherichia coli]|nr:type II secretion system minor pseudopilin GspH [Escherichia coli]
MVTWTQMYMPMGGLGLSALVALIPIIFFFVALAVLRLKGHVAGAITLILSILIAIFAFKMPIDMAFAAAGYGFIYGLWPIAWIIVAAVFLYKLTVASGQFDIIRSSVISITDDQRLQVLLIGFSFGALLEGAAGFGAPVAITGALLVGLGFKPLYAAGLCLIANTAPVAFGALGVPILVAGQVTGIDPFHIGAMAGRQLPFLSVLVPFWLVAMMDGWKGVKETWPAALVAGGSFAVTQFFTSNYIGPELPDITSALVSIVSLALFLKVWRPKNTETAISMGQSAGAMVVNKPSSGGPVPSEYSLGQIIRAWSPFLILTVLVTIWTMKPFKALFAPGGAFYSLVINFQIPHLHQQVLKAAPIVAQPTPMDAVFKFDPLSAGGTAIFIAAIISIFILGVGIKKGIGVFAETLISLKWPIIDPPGYQFMQRRQGQWLPVSAIRLSAQVTVPKQVQMLLQPGSDIWQKEYALELQRRRLTLHDIELELQKEAKKKTPQIRFSPFEPATPFTLRFYSAAQNACWAVKLAHDGALSLNQCDERMP